MWQVKGRCNGARHAAVTRFIQWLSATPAIPDASLSFISFSLLSKMYCAPTQRQCSLAVFCLTRARKSSIIIQYACCGGVTQLVRVVGSYPACHPFESDRRYHVGASSVSLAPLFYLNSNPPTHSPKPARAHTAVHHFIKCPIRLVRSLTCARTTAYCRKHLSVPSHVSQHRKNAGARP